MILEMDFKKRVNLYANDADNHYNTGAVWNGDWRKGRLLKGWFGNDVKPRHYAVSMGRQSAYYKYANALAFFPMTSKSHERDDCLIKIPAGVLEFLPYDTFVLPIRMLMKEVQLECWADANYQGDLPESLINDLRASLSVRIRSYKMEMAK